MILRLARRLLASALLLLLISALSFLLAELAPGDFLAEMRFHPGVSAETLEHLRQLHGIDRPLSERYVGWLMAIGRGELGHSFAHNLPVVELLAPRARNTLILTITATCGLWLLALTLASAAARHPRGAVDRWATAGCALLLALPRPLLALAALLLAARVSWLPSSGMRSLPLVETGNWHPLLDGARHLLLPAATLILAGLPTLYRHLRGALSEAFGEPHVAAARGHGIGRRRLFWRYVLPSAAGRLTSLLGLSIGGLLSGSLVVEVVLGWPGLGPLMLDAVLARDIYLVVAGTLMSATLLIAGNLLADGLLLVIDPRLREHE